MDKENVVCTHLMEYYTATSKDNLRLWQHACGSCEHYAKWNKSEKDKYCETSPMRDI